MYVINKKPLITKKTMRERKKRREKNATTNLKIIRKKKTLL